MRAKPWTPPTPQEQAAFAALYKMEPRDIDLGGLNPGFLLAALYNNALSGGAGLDCYKSAS